MGFEDTSPVDGAAAPEGLASLPEVTDWSAPNTAQTDGFAEVLEGTLAQTLSRPGTGDDPGEAAALTQSVHGPVGAERAAMDAGPGQGEQPSGPDGSEMVQEHHEDRLRDLYLDLAQYQVAWRIIQKIQQDISQLMRGM
jgi:hypothetical protein